MRVRYEPNSVDVDNRSTAKPHLLNNINLNLNILMYPQITEKSYLEARKTLTRATRVDALACIHVAQHQAADALFRSGATERLVRMATSDIVESLLAKAIAVIGADQQFCSIVSAGVREAFIEAHLRAALASWLMTNARSVQELQALEVANVLLNDKTP